MNVSPSALASSQSQRLACSGNEAGFRLFICFFIPLRRFGQSAPAFGAASQASTGGGFGGFGASAVRLPSLFSPLCVPGKSVKDSHHLPPSQHIQTSEALFPH